LDVDLDFLEADSEVPEIDGQDKEVNIQGGSKKKKKKKKIIPKEDVNKADGVHGEVNVSNTHVSANADIKDEGFVIGDASKDTKSLIYDPSKPHPL
jgi:hypothetical protein